MLQYLVSNEIWAEILWGADHEKMIVETDASHVVYYRWCLHIPKASKQFLLWNIKITPRCQFQFRYSISASNLPLHFLFPFHLTILPLQERWNKYQFRSNSSLLPVPLTSHDSLTLSPSAVPLQLRDASSVVLKDSPLFAFGPFGPLPGP
jgi:hypothetical protein